MLFRFKFLVPVCVAVLGGCSQGKDNILASLFVSSLSTDTYLDVYNAVVNQSSFRSKLATFGRMKWTQVKQIKVPNAVNLDGRLLRLDLISPTNVSSGIQSMSKIYRDRSAFWKSIGLDVNAKITAAQVKAGVEVVSNLANRITSSPSHRVKITKDDLKAIQRLNIVMSATRVNSLSTSVKALALDEGEQQEQQQDHQQEQNSGDNQEQQGQSQGDEQGQQPVRKCPGDPSDPITKECECWNNSPNQAAVDSCLEKNAASALLQEPFVQDCSFPRYAAQGICAGRTGAALEECQKDQEGKISAQPEYSGCRK